MQNTTNLRRGFQIAAVGAVGAVAVGFLSAGAANADTFVPLPDNTISKTLIDGTTVTIDSVGNSALISPSMGATPTQRNVWVTGNYTVDTSNASGGSIEPGFLVGCQVDFAAAIGADGNVSFGQGNTISLEPGTLDLEIDRTQPNTYSIGAGVTLDLAPGQFNDVKLVADEKSAEIDGVTVATETSNSFSFDGNGGGYTFADETLSVSGCAGYAEARAYVKVTVDNDAVTASTTLWGQPFSIG